jgi:hypothetical protein|tara:strand:- start:313 stop:786 length:474 start_codon:yes stop_codon:yes gene_type:complete
MKKKILFPILIIFLLINSCGFKIVNKSEIYKFDINEIITTGDDRINFKIKNKLIFSSEKNEKKLVDIYLDTNKSKEVKEKNINNEITKYQISIASTVRVKELVSEKEISFNVVKTGDYSVASQYSQTLANEKKLIEVLTEDVTESILNAIVLKLDDL